MSEGLAYRPPVSQDDFIDWETGQPERYELIGSEVTAMVGGTADHGGVTVNLTALMQQGTRGTRCRVFSENMKLCCPNGGVTYPDLMVVCRPVVGRKALIIEDPTLIAEVLSASSEHADPGRQMAGLSADRISPDLSAGRPGPMAGREVQPPRDRRAPPGL